MKKEDLRIVFMGTPGFAVESLRALVENDYNIVGVITSPDKPAGRGYKIQQSPVKEYALSANLNILQPINLKDERFIEELRTFRADIHVVVAFRMLPEIVWDMPPKGTFNLHASLLPQYRGAAPINWAIINGEKETGVTTFFLKHEIDTGEIIFSEKIDIKPNDNAGIIHDKLMHLGAELVKKTIDAVIEDNISTIPQNRLYADISELKSAPKISRETCRINWDLPAQQVHDHIRGLSPYPAAWSSFEVSGKSTDFKIFKSSIQTEKHTHAPGTLITDNKTTLQIAVQDGFIDILELQMSGKRRMKIIDFLNGFSFD